MKVFSLISMLFFLFIFPILIDAEEIFLSMPVSSLKIKDGKLEDFLPERGKYHYGYSRELSTLISPRIVMSGKDDEAYLTGSLNRRWQRRNISESQICIKTHTDSPKSGTIFLINRTADKFSKINFEFNVPLKSDSEKDELQFWRERKKYYRKMLSLPGAAWFRHKIIESEKKIAAIQNNKADSTPNRTRRRRRNLSNFDDTLDIFAGGRAISENLQLDRELNVQNPPGDPSVSLESIEGITVKAFDWEKRLAGLKPELDALADIIPAEQYAVFVPSFANLLELSDESHEIATPIFRLAEGRSVHSAVAQRYRTQLCLPKTDLARLLGPSVISEVALTGSDPYFRTGTDLAVIFKPKVKNLLISRLVSNQDESCNQNKSLNPEKVEGTVKGIDYRGVVTADSVIKSYMADLGNAVVVTNSLLQLKKIIDVKNGNKNSVKSLDEYKFFRSRYKIGDEDEMAFFILTDEFIRRLSSPRWRIGASRRTRAAAVLSELTAEIISRKKLEKAPEWLGEIQKLNKNTVNSEIYGNIGFLTPISELEFTKVTDEEKSAYIRFRANYQRQWRNFFDPIALKVSRESEKWEFDLTVMPLIQESDYKDFSFFSASGGVELKKGDGDPHDDALAYYANSLDTDSKEVSSVSNSLGIMMQNSGLKKNPLSWLGSWVCVYADESPFWKEMSDAFHKSESDGGDFMENNIHRLPLALGVAVNNPMKLALFLTVARAFISSSAPDMLKWENFTHKDQAYVCISQKKKESYIPEKLKIYYVPLPEMLLVSFSENLIKNAIERNLNKEESDKTTLKHPMLGKTAVFSISGKLANIAENSFANSAEKELRIASWKNIPILNQWHKLYPDKDSVEMYKKDWDVQLICPGGGEYVWNEKANTFESSVFGFPGKAKKVDRVFNILGKIKFFNSGISLGKDYLRARMNIYATSHILNHCASF